MAAHEFEFLMDETVSIKRLRLDDYLGNSVYGFKFLMDEAVSIKILDDCLGNSADAKGNTKVEIDEAQTNYIAYQVSSPVELIGITVYQDSTNNTTTV